MNGSYHKTSTIHDFLALASILLIAVVLHVPEDAAAAPKSDLWPIWTAHDESSRSTLDHSAWDKILGMYVKGGPDGINRVDYAGIKAGASGELDAYIRSLESRKVMGLNRVEQEVYWINLYNALTVRLIVTHYPVESIKDINISPGFFSFGPWDKKLVRIEGQDVSLNDIEHRILRPVWKDPRVHYAVNCASLGCPNLGPAAYTAANLDELLDKAARSYVNHPRGARVEKGKLVVSSIYEWFKEDFGGSDEGVIRHLMKYAGEPLAAKLRGVRKISDDEYDWSLNGL